MIDIHDQKRKEFGRQVVAKWRGFYSRIHPWVREKTLYIDPETMLWRAELLDTLFSQHVRDEIKQIPLRKADLEAYKGWYLY